MNFIARNDKAIALVALGMIVAGFLCDVKWTVLGQAVGAL